MGCVIGVQSKNVDKSPPQFHECKEYSQVCVDPIWVVKVYDGDTFIIGCHVPGDDQTWYKFPVRIRNIDCPEMRTNDDSEKHVAQIAKAKVIDLLYEKQVKLKNIKKDKYGRLLCDVLTLDNKNVGDCLLKERLAVVYDGKTKQTPKNWESYYYGPR